jgi:hypothetical protein
MSAKSSYLALVTVGILLLAGGHSQAHPFPGFTYTDLGALSGAGDSFSTSVNNSGQVMDIVDHNNSKYRRNTIHLASEGVNRTWSMRRSFKSPNYTGEWNELPVVS